MARIRASMSWRVAGRVEVVVEVAGYQEELSAEVVSQGPVGLGVPARSREWTDPAFSPGDVGERLIVVPRRGHTHAVGVGVLQHGPDRRVCAHRVTVDAHPIKIEVWPVVSQLGEYRHVIGQSSGLPGGDRTPRPGRPWTVPASPGRRR